MNEEHLALCSSAEWAEAIQRWIIPWVLDSVDLAAALSSRLAGTNVEVICAPTPHRRRCPRHGSAARCA